jgi:formylglycine-generating enzyme required for sulfatase activity
MILIIALALWGGNKLIDYLHGTETLPTIATTEIAVLYNETDTSPPASATFHPTDILDTVSASSPKPTTTTLATILTQTQTPALPDTPTPEPTATSSPTSTELPTWISDGLGVPMVLVPAGSFEMDSDADDALAKCQLLHEPFSGIPCLRDWLTHEEPIHTVTLVDFYIDQYEVTNEQFAEFPNDKDNQNEGEITWLDANDENVRLFQSEGDWKPING